jgi:hypothetical protein
MKEMSAVYNTKPAVRTAVAGNPNTPEPALRHLSRSVANDVLLALAGNPSSPTSIVTDLLRHPDRDIAQTAASKPNLLPAVLAMWQLTT